MARADASSYEPFGVTVVPDRHEVVVAATGELDLASAEVLHREIRDLRAAGFQRVVVDLRRVPFMDSTGLRVLLALRNDARRADGALVLVPGPAEVQRVFEVTATRGLFEWRDY